MAHVRYYGKPSIHYACPIASEPVLHGVLAGPSPGTECLRYTRTQVGATSLKCSVGFHGDKVPDIDLNWQYQALPATQELFGRSTSFRHGHRTLAGNCYGFVAKYLERIGETRRSAGSTAWCKITGVRRHGQHQRHDGGPRGHGYPTSPIRYPAMMVRGIITADRLPRHPRQYGQAGY